MGTIKNYLGITQTNSFGTSFTIDDKGEGLSLLSSLEKFHKNLVPAPDANDLYIAGPNLIFSFSLSRTTAEALISRYKQVNYSLTITGINYKQVQETVLISKLHTTGVNEAAIKWDGSYGILRIGIPLSNTIADSSITVGKKLFDFNSISAIGIAIVSEGDENNSSGMAHIFSLGK